MKNGSGKFLFYCQIRGGSDVLNISSALNISPLMWRDSSITEVELICDVGRKVEINLWKFPKYHSAIVCPILEEFALCLGSAKVVGKGLLSSLA